MPGPGLDCSLAFKRHAGCAPTWSPKSSDNLAHARPGEYSQTLRRDLGSRSSRKAPIGACASGTGATPARGGGGERDRTDDLLLAKQALSQLSYTPDKQSHQAMVVGLGRFELPTSRLSGVRSNQLSYRPGAHPATRHPGLRPDCWRSSATQAALPLGR
jgi:hypothetical protein